MQEEEGSKIPLTFSFENKVYYDINGQEKCYLIYTNEKTHKIINDNLNKSSMYGGFVSGVGPRYCPSIEDKLVRFKDKERHQLFLEPESRFYDEWYLQGFSTSMPRDVQEKMVHSLEGLEKAIITKYAYAIEYDAIDPLQLLPTLETKIIKNLYTAGQINGTSGYEEAAAQGLIAGINASLNIDNEEQLVLRRDEAYIGVLIDDLVTKGTKEPYRMLTSRAEFRLILRHDNADVRLTNIGYKAKSVSKEAYNRYLKKLKLKEELIDYLKNNSLNIKDNKEKLFNLTNTTYTKNIKLIDALKHPEITINILDKIYDLSKFKEVLEEVEIEIKYDGYIKKAYKEKEKLLKLEKKQIPENINYDLIKNLSSESRQKLKKVNPRTLGQASRISGVNPVDISILAIYLKKEYANDN
jgi:tRNA uridine 5-carboxymethylaminomethyl modification enzyme